ncbi:MAG: CHAT domain-containing protein, partial [Saprospiraceae bacterium]|nr:CHAT domain-containing protein [Saprospiraceae bacterium]
TLAMVLGEKGQILKDYSQQTQDEELLKLAMTTFSRAIEAIDAAQFSYKSKGSVANLKAEFDPVYEHAIAVAFMLYEKSKEDQYLDQAFKFSEKNKAALLVAALNETRAREFAGIPLELQEKESTLKRNLGYYEQLLLEGNEEAEADLQNKIFNLKNQYDLFIDDIEKNYPKYFQLKYEAATITASDVQKSLTDDEVLIEYFLGQEDLYAFVFGSTFADFIKINIEEGFLERINELRLTLADPGGDLSHFRNISNRLYRDLMLPFDERLNGQHLTFILDNELGYIPFEVLVKNESGEVSISNAYLLEEHAISYSYSATFRDQMMKERRSNKDVRYLAFAPNFNDRDEDGDPDEPDLLAYNDLVRGGLAELKGAQREVESLATFFDGDYFQQFDAHESLFKSIGKNYEIIHLATHAIIDDINPLNSRLLFTIEGDTADDGNLHAWELFSMNLDADLAVLSACNTGFGKIQKGEGIQSLGRAFAYAGCPSRLMSLWPAQDASTADIMEDFYSQLSGGLSKDEALRRAKLSYLEGAAEFNLHPFYWAGFVLQGDPTPLVEKSRWWLWGLIILALPIAMLIFRRRFITT